MSEAEPHPPGARLLRLVLAEVDGPRLRQGMPPRFPLAAEVNVLYVPPPSAPSRSLVKAL